MRIELDEHYTLKLAPQGEVKYAAKVGKPTLAEGAQGGLATVHVTAPGRYRVSITAGRTARSRRRQEPRRVARLPGSARLREGAQGRGVRAGRGS